MAAGAAANNVQLVTSEFLSADDVPPGTHLHLIVLNYVLPMQTAQLWKRATTRICADGGANRLYDQIAGMLPAGVDAHTARTSHLPDLIKGDLDSVRPDVQAFYTSHGVPMIDLSSDQETTDLEKCLLFLEGRVRAMGQQQQHEQQQVHKQHQSAAHTGYAGALSSSGSSSTSYAAAAAAAAAAARIPREQPSTQQQQQQVEVLQHNGTHQQQHQDQQQQQQQDQPSLHPISGRVVFLDPADRSSSRGGAAAALPQADPVDQQQQHHHHHHHQQQQQQQAATAAAVLDAGGGSAGHGNGASSSSSGSRQGVPAVASDAPFSSPSDSSSPSSTTNGAAAAAGAAGAARQVYASVLGSDSDDVSAAAAAAAAAGAPAAKRVHQEHIILVLGALGGRLDHTLSNLNTLYCFRHLNMALWGDGNLVRLLRAGTSTIRPARCEGPTCGLVPLARPATASSSGLKWNLDNTHMCFRGLLSTSNVIMSDTVTVATDEDLLWITAVEDTAAGAPSKL